MEEPSREHNGYAWRMYESGDGEQCKEMERQATQGGMLHEVAFIHKEAYDAKARQFTNHAIFVVHPLQERDKVVAVVVAGIEPMVQQPVKQAADELRHNVTGVADDADVKCVAYVFDLRVSPQHTRRGIATWIMEVCEWHCAVRLGCDRVYLSVNVSNAAARKLYERRGYEVLDERRIKASIVFLPWLRSLIGRSRAVPPGVRVLGADDAQRLAQKRSVVDRDLVPYALDMLFGRSPYFIEGLAIDRGDEGGAFLALCDGSGLTSIEMVRLVVPLRWFGLWWVRAVLFLVGAAAAALMWSSCGILTRAAMLLLFLVVGVVASFFCSRQKFRCRVFAPAAWGHSGIADLDVLWDVAQQRAAESGYSLVVCNLSKRGELAKGFAAGSPQTLLLSRPLAGERKSAAKEGCFFDPRII